MTVRLAAGNTKKLEKALKKLPKDCAMFILKKDDDEERRAKGFEKAEKAFRVHLK